MPPTNPGSTSSKTGTFYFAYGSNLSYTQMSLRLPYPDHSAEPVALARLDHHKWIIRQRGYVNVVALPDSNVSDDANSVWGLVYNLSAENEAVLDRYEGHDESRNPAPEKNENPSTKHIRPWKQGNWDYNKHYLPVTVTKWFRNPKGFGVDGIDSSALSDTDTTITILVYVDEYRTEPGRINWEYIGRMNRAISQSTELGLPTGWVNKIMRKYIPPGVSVDDENYVGTNKGYIEEEQNEEFRDEAAKKYIEQDRK